MLITWSAWRTTPKPAMKSLKDTQGIGVLLVNSGTPDAPEEEAIRTWLEQMLTDPVLIACPMPIWRRVLDYVILPRRPKKNVPRYKRFWTPEGSPFILDSLAQGRALEKRLVACDVDAKVEVAMRYGNPSIASKLELFKQAGVSKLIVIPMYPQECKSCTGTILPEVKRLFDVLVDSEWNPELLEIPHYYDNPLYLKALSESVSRVWSPQLNARLAISFHSEPVKFIEDGDPYQDQINETAENLAASLGLSDDTWQVTYQSRFDNRKWLGPLLEPTLELWAEQGVKDVCVVCPGFAADCLETSMEVAEEARDFFLAAAGEGARFTYVPALGADVGLIAALTDEVLRRLKENR